MLNNSDFISLKNKNVIYCNILIINCLKHIFEKMTKQDSRPDLLWKDLATEFEEDFILYFFGKELHEAIDFSVKSEYLEQEFNETFAANEPNKKVADKIIRFRLKDGGTKYVIVHIEFQGQSEKDFVRRMFRYFVYIFFKYDTTDVTALALYTGASRPKVHDCFEIVNFGTEIKYKFNTYSVREQTEEELLKSDNPFSYAVLASLYLIEAGKDAEKKFSFKKKLVEIALKKKFDHAKLYRLLNFVQYLVKLPKDLDIEFKASIKQSKIDEKMEYSKDFLETYGPLIETVLSEEFKERREKFLEKADKEALEEARKRALEQVRKEGLDEIRKKIREEELEKLQKDRGNTVINLHRSMGVNAVQIANILKYDIDFVQSVLDTLEK